MYRKFILEGEIIMCRLDELKNKEVINECDGKRLGYICDLELDVKCGKILSIIVPAEFSLRSIFGRCREYVIPWDSICRIGEDIILVDVSSCTCTERPLRKR